MQDPARRTPLKGVRLRQPGQSIREEIEREREDVLFDHILPFAIVVTLWVMTGVAWLFRTPPVVPFVLSSIALVVIAVRSVPRTIAAYHQVKRLRLGFDGERTVAEHLELLQLDGWRVVHDLRGEGFNVDHVIVGPQGVFTVETKTLRKPVADRNARVRFDGVSLTVDSHRFDRDPLAQARAQADWVSRRLEQLTMRRFPVRPVVVFPGWFVEHAKGMKSEVWVLEPKALRGWLKHEPQRLAAADVALVRDRLVSLAGDGDTPGPTG